MKAVRRMRWRPRFSLSHLLMMMVVIGLGLSWYNQCQKLRDQAETIAEQRLELIRLAVNSILRSEHSDEEKVQAIGAFIAIGDPATKIKGWSRFPSQFPLGENKYVVTPYDCDLWATCRLIDDRICELGYLKSDGNGMAYAELSAEPD